MPDCDFFLNLDIEVCKRDVILSAKIARKFVNDYEFKLCSPFKRYCAEGREQECSSGHIFWYVDFAEDNDPKPGMRDWYVSWFKENKHFKRVFIQTMKEKYIKPPFDIEEHLI